MKLQARSSQKSKMIADKHKGEISALLATSNQHPRNPFPAWRLPNGISSADDSDLERSIGSCELWEWYGGGLVIFGVAATVVIAALHPSYDSFWERWGSAISDSLVAIGVAVEIKFGQMAGLRQIELKLRSDEAIAEANKIAAQAAKDSAEARQRTAEMEAALQEAKLKLFLAESKAEPRTLSVKDRAVIAELIKDKIIQTVSLVFEQTEKAHGFGWSLWQALKDAGVPLDPMTYKMPPGERLMCPVMVHSPGGNNDSFDPLCDAFQKANIRFGRTSLTVRIRRRPPCREGLIC